MAVDTPARHIYKGNGTIRVFPIPTEIIGDDYVRIEIDGIYQSDRSKWDIVNNSIIFIEPPTNLSIVDIQVATSVEALNALGSTTSMDIVAGSIDSVNVVANNINNINNLLPDSDNISIVAEDIDSVKTVSTDINNVKTNAINIEAINTNAINIEAIQNASNNASEASDSAISASNSANSAQTSLGTLNGILATLPDGSINDTVIGTDKTYSNQKSNELFVLKASLESEIAPYNGGRKNYLINSNFKINQRGYVSGTATTVVNQYTLDRWYIPTIGEFATFTETNGIVTITAPASGICQKIENTSNNGYTRTISYIGTATLTVTESSDNVTYTPVILIGNTFTPTAGKYVKITLSNGTVSLIKDEDGSVATDGWHPYDGEFGGEIQACQRYLPSFSGVGNTHVVGNCSATDKRYDFVYFFKTETRIPPTGYSISSISHFNIGDGVTINETAQSFTFSGANSGTANFSTTGLTSTVAGRPGRFFGNTAAAKIYFTGCEL